MWVGKLDRMATVQSTPRRWTPWRVIRRVVGWGVLSAGILAAVLFGLGLFNPWQLVVLEYRFGNPMLGLLVVPLTLLIGAWLALPVTNEARQAGRLATRLGLVALCLIGLIGWGVFGDHFTFTPEPLERRGDLTLVLVRDRGVPQTVYLRVWHGSGLTARETGEVGRVCGSVSAQFLSADRIMLDTAYGDWVLELDPATGAPQQVLGPRCGDPPRPVK
jgi:hypothetical protein